MYLCVLSVYMAHAHTRWAAPEALANKPASLIFDLVLSVRHESVPLGTRAQRASLLLLQADCEACAQLLEALEPHLVDRTNVLKFHRVLDVTTRSSAHTNCFTKVRNGMYACLRCMCCDLLSRCEETLARLGKGALVCSGLS